MRRSQRLLFSAALVAALFAASAFFGIQGIAHAQANQQTRHQAPCSGTGCNNKDPEQTGCAIGAYTVQTGVLTTAYIQLRYSPRCHTNWGRVVNRGNHNNVYLVLVDRIDGLSYGSKGLVGSIAWSNMIYAPVAAARACVSINGASPACTTFV